MQQIVIPYQKWNLIAWLNEQDGNAWIAVRPICEAIGIDWRSQYVKLKSDPRFSCGDITMTGADGKQYMMTSLPASQIAGWLYGINSRRVGPEVAPLLLEFQQYCTQAIYTAVSGQANQAVAVELCKRIDDLVARIAALTQRVEAQDQEIAQLRRQVGPTLNEVVSGAARTLRHGHLKN